MEPVYIETFYGIQVSTQSKFCQSHLSLTPISQQKELQVAICEMVKESLAKEQVVLKERKEKGEKIAVCGDFAWSHTGFSAREGCVFP